MSPSIEEQIESLKHTIAEMESQRPSLGDEIVDAGLTLFQHKLDELVAMLQSQIAQAPTETTQQRKLVSMLFMDIAGSTAIAQQMDPEDVGEVFDVTLKKLALPVEAHGGRVTRFMGDGFLSAFGAQTAREDDPEQAVRAGLKIIEMSNQIAEELEKEWGIKGFQVRVGINTGLVLLGGETEAGDTLMGAAVNLAARLEGAAPPGGLLISHDTYRHVRGVFDVEPWQPLHVKGFDEAVQAYHILRARPRAFRTYTPGVEGVETRMVGREAELKHLQGALLTAIEDGECQVVTIIGEAGVGKSRLLFELQNWIELLPQTVRFFKGAGRQEAQGLPYGLLRYLFEYRFQIQEDDCVEAAREKVRSGFGEVFGEGDESLMRADILGQLMGYDFSASPHLKGVLDDAEQLRNRGLMYLGEYIRAVSEQSPVVVFLEDIHWADDSTLDALNWLEERLYRQRLLIVGTARQTLFERRPYWGEGISFHRRINLEPLTRRESRQLVKEILRLVQDIPSELSELVLESAEGNPFYVEELIKMLVENGVIVKGVEHWYVEEGRLAQLEVPATLMGVLQARLDSLSAGERTILQQASVVGRQFWDQVLAYIQTAGDGMDESLLNTLIALRQRELVYRREESAFAGASEFIFKHDILREVTYESVLKRLRRRYHALVAEWFIIRSEDRASEYSGTIAGHLLMGGRKEQACGYFLQAGEAALASFGNHEAGGYFRQVLELSPTDTQKAACLKGLGEALYRQGSRPEAKEIFRQGIDLYIELGDSNRAAELYARLSRVLWVDHYESSWSACQEGLIRLEGMPESPGMALLLAETGRAAFFLKMPVDQVIEFCQQAIEIAERQGAQEARVEAIITIAMAIRDVDRSINLLQEAATLSEANGLWRLAIRAHTNIAYILSNNFLSLESVNKHDRKSADLSKQSGDIELLFLTLGNVIDGLIGLGKFNSTEDTLSGLFQNYTAPKARIEEFLNEQYAIFYSARGEWSQALELSRQHLSKLRETGRFQMIANHNLALVNECLELNRFAGMNDLTEAEAALGENIRIKWAAIQSRFQMVVLFSRQQRLKEAHECLVEVINDLEQPISRDYEVFKSQAESELAHAEGRWDDATSACQMLVDIYKSCGHRWGWARWLIDLGDGLLGRKGPGDRKKAEEAYRKSLEMFTEMGAPGYIQVLEGRLVDLQSS